MDQTRAAVLRRRQGRGVGNTAVVILELEVLQDEQLKAVSQITAQCALLYAGCPG